MTTAPWREFLSAPLVPVALAATLGVLAAPLLPVPSWLVLVSATVAFVLLWRLRSTVYLYLAVAFLALASARWPVESVQRSETILAEKVGKPIVVRGVLAEEPVRQKRTNTDPLEPVRLGDTDRATMELEALQTAEGWQPASGVLRLWVEHVGPANDAPLLGLRVGDTVQITGRFRKHDGPANPGEHDTTQRDLDQRIVGDLSTKQLDGSIVRLEGGSWSIAKMLGTLRHYGTATLEKTLPDVSTGIARALLLGDGTAMDRPEWESYIRTGTVHVLAISGQHLVLLAAFLWFVLGSSGVSSSRAAWLVMLVVVAYAMLTGLRPSALRAAVMVCSACGAIVLKRPWHVANSFALAWIVVLIQQPANIADLGGRLSFLSVFVLIWGAGRWLVPRPVDPLDRLIDESRPVWLRVLRSLGKSVAVLYLVNAVLFVANTPLLVTEQNVASPVGLLVGPLLVLLTSVALVAGFLLLLLGWVPLLGSILAFITNVCLQGCTISVHAADALPGGTLWLPALPWWWVLGFYGLLGAVVLFDWATARRVLFGLIGWIVLAVVFLGWPVSTNDELRVTFLAVGHGTCVVIETPDGRCLLYDTGSLGGPDTVRRVVAPYLWHRGHRRIDEVFVSHADSDHFNGLGQLARRFPIGHVTLTPSFATKPTKEVAEILAVLAERRIPHRVANAGDRFTSGEVEFRVLHPPADGPTGSENERSLVLLLQHSGHRLLLTGDLEKAGTGIVTQLPKVQADVIQAPHHGSQGAYTPEFRAWAEGKLVIATRGDLFRNTITEMHTGTRTLDTNSAGAITVRSHRTGLLVECFRNRTVEVVK
jgi:competence protein ComEC